MTTKDDTSTAPAAPAAVPARNGLGISAFVLGIVGTVMGTIPILGIPALACGLTGTGLGLGAYRRLRARTADNKVMTRIGLVLSVVAIILGIVGIVIVTRTVNDLNNQLSNLNAG